MDNAGIAGVGAPTADQPTDSFDKVRLITVPHDDRAGLQVLEGRPLLWLLDPYTKVTLVQPNHTLATSAFLSGTCWQTNTATLWVAADSAGDVRKCTWCVSVPQAPDPPHAGDSRRTGRNCDHIIRVRCDNHSVLTTAWSRNTVPCYLLLYQ